MPKPRPDKAILPLSLKGEVTAPSDKFLECQKNLDSLIQANENIADNSDKGVFGITKSNDKVLLFCNIPIVIAYMKKNTLLGILLFHLLDTT